MTDDFLSELLQRIIDSARREGGFDESLAREIERQVRRDWGGDRVYIGKTPSDARIEIFRRNEAIMREIEAGERVSLIARRHNVSRRMVHKIWQWYRGGGARCSENETVWRLRPLRPRRQLRF